VERLVKDLFGIGVKSVMGFRHLILGKGVRLTSNASNPEITFERCSGRRYDVLKEKYGDENGNIVIDKRKAKEVDLVEKLGSLKTNH
jgi:hypothetical protein